MANTTVNKVVLGNETLLDLTADTVTPQTLYLGTTAHDASGAAIVGTMSGGGTEAGTVTQDENGFLVLDDDAPSGRVTVEALSVTQNGTYTAPTGKAYSPVTVNVSGGDSPYTLLDSSEFSVTTTSTSATSVGTITLGNSLYTANAIIYVKVRDKAGKRKGYFYGTDTFFVNTFAAKGISQSLISIRPSILYSFDGNGLTTFNPTGSGFVSGNSTSSYGVYASTITGSGNVAVQSRYHSNTGTIDGTYTVDVYLLKWPDNTSPISSVV